MRQAEHYLRVEVAKIAEQMLGEELDDEEILGLGEQLKALAAVCDYCDGQGATPEEPGVMEDCPKCKGEGFKAIDEDPYRRAPGKPVEYYEEGMDVLDRAILSELTRLETDQCQQ
jgi:hypothetical protein